MGVAELVIPERTKRALLKAVKDQTTPHAYMFVGPEGVGKHTTALALAKALNCPARTGDACDRCMVCVRIDRHLHPDVHLIAPQGQTIKIDQIRQLQDLLMLQAYEGRMKVAILDDAHKLTLEAANSLLKILEEPPGATLFVLVCRHLGGLPATIVSRAQVWRFGLLPREQIVALLRQRPGSPTDTERAASLSGGRPGKALALDLPTAMGVRSEACQLMAQAQAGDPAVILAAAEQWARRKKEHDLLFEMLLSLMRDLAIFRAGGSETTLIHGDIWPGLSPSLGSLPTATIWEVFEIIHTTQQAITHNANPQLAFEVMLFKIGDAYARARQRDRHRTRYCPV